MIGDRWGVTDEEVARRYPCDDIVPAPSLSAWRGVTVNARPEAVWPWVMQIQWAPYAYDWIDSLGKRSPQRLLGFPQPVPGDHFTSTAGRPQGRVLSIETQVHYTGRIMGGVLSYVLVPVGDDTTRLLLKVVVSGYRWLAPAVSVGDLVMARRQLLNLRRLAESDPS
ncbi:polyketide cyclase [Rhodococcus artemisiae]|uniref:Polyketide cyclase n=1 Tax=Rhodococcus artemisiae TaxID=714159 RepID=A0ABU7L7L4_9NOCA|nr:polyketide cyclase [Rhodococcus artemisiae]MEE2057322.1 polyketide cyclase [Rhodococcus artemisiae]